MIQAISQSHSSESSFFGSYLSELIGFESITPRKSNRKLKVDLILNSYQEELDNKMRGSYAWQGFIGNLVVDLDENNQVVIFIEGSDDIADRINLLEFGTPEVSPDPMIRVSEAKFNDDFQSKRMFVL